MADTNEGNTSASASKTNKKTKNQKDRVAATDCGTMFFQTAEVDENNETVIQRTRNAFVELNATEDVDEVLRRNDWQYVQEGNKYYVLGEDSLRVANMFPGKIELRRPLQQGVLNKGEDKKMLVLTHLIEHAVGSPPNDRSVMCTCISSEPADDSVDSAFHKARLMGIFKNLGWHAKVIEEGHAVVLSERPTVVEEDGTESPYSGIGLSFGAGRSNCVLAYKGLQVVGMSASRSGDYVDQKVAEATGEEISQVTRVKEKKLDFDNIDYDDDIIFALDAYYGEMIKYVLNRFSKKFSQEKTQFETPLDIIVAGGTSMPKGFCNKVKEVMDSVELPFEVNDVKHASEPRDAVVKGCLTQALATHKKLVRDDASDIDSLLEE